MMANVDVIEQVWGIARSVVEFQGWAVDACRWSFPAPHSSQMQSFGIGKFVNINHAVRAIISQVRRTAGLEICAASHNGRCGEEDHLLLPAGPKLLRIAHVLPCSASELCEGWDRRSARSLQHQQDSLLTHRKRAGVGGGCRQPIWLLGAKWPPAARPPPNTVGGFVG